MAGIARIVLLVMAAFVFSMMDAPIASANGDSAQIIGTVPLGTSGVTQNVYRHVDRLVPALKRLSADKIIKLECRYVGSSAREQDVLKAFIAAGRIEKYLREHHKLALDLWVTARIGAASREHSPSLIFSVFSEDIRNLDKLPVVPAKNSTDTPPSAPGEKQ